MSSIDSRIVTMKFDNTAFQRGVSTTLDALSKLSAAVTNMGSSKSLGSIDTSKATTGLAQVGAATDTIAGKFSAMSVVAVTALATIANKATESALSFVKGFTFGPIMDGLSEYQLNLQSIQTIQANTDRPLTEINASLDELNKYSDQTIYNFAEMAKNIGTFTAAGVELKTATSAIKGIANMAALSGSTSQQAAGAMYQLSQAIASGRVGLMDWNSVVNAGMGGKKLQTALAQTAVAMGELTDNAVSGTKAMDQLKINGASFRESISASAGDDPWLTSKVLENTLASLDGRFSMMALTTEKAADGTMAYTKETAKASIEAARLAMEQKNGVKYTDEQFKALMQLSDSSFLAATQVKTLSQVFAVAKETLASGWAATFRNIFGDFGEAKKTFTELSGFINDGINAMALARNKVLSKWNDLGGRDLLIQGLKNAFEALSRIVTPIAKAFRDIFPPQTAKDLLGMTQAFTNFTESLIIGGPAIRDIRNIFGAVFGVMGVGWEVVKGLLRSFFSLFDLFGGGAAGILDLSGSFAEVVKNLTEWILKGDYIAKFFDKAIAGRAALLEPIVDFLGDILSALAGFASTGAEVVIDSIASSFAYLAPILSDIGSFLKDKVIAGFERLQPVLLKIKDAIADAFGSLSGIGGSAAGALGGLGAMFDIGDPTDDAASGIDKVKNALSSSGSIADKAKSAFEGLVGFLKGLGGFLADLGGNISSVLGQIWDDVVETFTDLGGGAAGVAGGIKSFFGAIGGFISDFMGEMFGDLNFGEVVVAINSLLFTGIAASFMRFLYQFGGIFKDMRGMFQSVGGIFDQVTNNLKTMQADVRANMILKIAVALGILAVSLYILSKIDGPALARSLGAIAAMLVMLVTAIKVIESNMPAESDWKEALRLGAIAAVILALAVAILALSVAVKIMGSMDLADLAKGLGGVAAVLAVIVAATSVLNKSGGAKSILVASVAIGILAFALTAFAGAIKLYSKIDTGTLAEGGAKIAAILIGLGLAMKFLPAASVIGASVGLFIIANALVVLAGALKIIATMDAGDSWQSILTLAAALSILVIAANSMNTAMTGAAAMVVLAAALALLIPQFVLLGSLDLATIGKGLLALVGIFTVLGLAGLILGPITPLILALGIALAALGAAMLLAGTGMFLFATGMTLMAAAGAAGVTILISVINQFLEALPGFVQRFGETISAIADVIRKTAPDMANAIGEAMRAFLREVIKTVPLIGKTFRVIIAEALKTIRAAVPDFIRTGFVILMAFLRGLESNMTAITNTAVSIIVKFINGIANSMDRIVKAGKNLVIKFVGAVVTELRGSAFEFLQAAINLGRTIVDGLVRAIDLGITAVTTAAKNLAQSALNAAINIIKPGSPSKVFTALGKTIPDGLAKGMDENSGGVDKSAGNMAKTALDAMRVAISGASDILDVAIDPTVTPVLDLTRLTAEANKINGLLSTAPLAAEMSYSQAALISSEAKAAQEAAAETANAGVTLNFEQNNQSPKALSAVEVYRQTRNQLALAKEALKV